MKKGSEGVATTSSSQKFYVVLHDKIHFELKQLQPGCKVGDLAGMLCAVLEMNQELDPCRPKPTTGKKDLFPLPVTRSTEVSPSHPKILQALRRSLNSLCGLETNAHTAGTVTSFRAMKRLGGIVVLGYFRRSYPKVVLNISSYIKRSIIKAKKFRFHDQSFGKVLTCLCHVKLDS